MKPVELVKVYDLIPIYKNGEEANAIQVARVETADGEQLQYDIVVGKGLYSIGDSVIYIQPDYSIPQTNVFMEYHLPDGDASKCRLGKKGRVRAIKFNFQFKDDFNPIFSCGIILPLIGEIKETVDNCEDGDLQKAFNVTKYVSEDSLDASQPSGNAEDFPSFLYKTDETTIQNCKRNVDRCEDEILIFSIKKDGSSLTQYYVDEETQGVCSREQKKSLDQTYITGYKNGDVVLHRYFQKDTQVLGWFDDSTQTFYTEEQAKELFNPIEIIRKDAWVDTVNKHGYYKKFVDYCKERNLKLALRGELIGQGNKGSGNKLNMDAKTSESDVYWFGVDDLTSGHSKRLHFADEYNLKRIAEELNLKYAEPVLEGKFTYAEIIAKCKEIFQEIQDRTGQIIEGIVIRTKNSNKLSCKYINPLYDSKS